jgi:prepilin-type N-terminal cleavage/methylation domain-containing protein
MLQLPNNRHGSRNGYSMVELLVVLVVLAVMAAISLPYLINFKKLYKTEDQALKVSDLLREANQLALTKRRTFRVEVDLTDNALLIIDEKGSSADILLKRIPLELPRDVRVDTIPYSVTKPNPPNYPDATFAADTMGHLDGTTTVTGHSVWAARFMSDGSIVNRTNVPINANLYFYPPTSLGSTIARNIGEVRALTISGGGGAVRYWKYNGSAFVASQ